MKKVFFLLLYFFGIVDALPADQYYYLYRVESSNFLPPIRTLMSRHLSIKAADARMKKNGTPFAYSPEYQYMLVYKDKSWGYSWITGSFDNLNN